MGFFSKLWRFMTTGEPPVPSAPPPPPRAQPTPPSVPRFDPQTGQPLATVPYGAATPPAPPAPRPEKPRNATLKLDAAHFTPLAGDALRAAARNLRPGWGAWFGLRSEIPPADDPRTNLIDRALVGHGLLTPEDLSEIHAIGDTMRRLRPTLAEATHAGNRAVTLDREARAKIKEQKRAESAERKRKRAEEVAWRKRTNIFFLGRGVSSKLSDRESKVGQLEAAGLPVYATPADLSQAMDIPIPRLRWLAFHSEAATVTHYVRFEVPKKSGGTRQLCAPHQGLASAQRWILDQIVSKVPPHAAAHGFVPTRSTVTNATPHVGRAIVLNTDLTDFFPTITFPRVRGLFVQLGYSPAVSTILALLCTEPPRRVATFNGQTFHVATGPRGLPQGACTSPAISNLIARRLDSRLNGIAKKLGWTYTRYADDLTFSAPTREADAQLGYLLARIRHIALDEGFAVNEKKTRVHRRSSAQKVTGIVVNESPHVPRATVRRVRAILHRAKTEGLAAQNRDHLPHFEAWLRGTIAYISMVNPTQAKPLAAALAEIRTG